MSSPIQVLKNISTAIDDGSEPRVLRWLKHPRLEVTHEQAPAVLEQAIRSSLPSFWLGLLSRAGFDLRARVNSSGEGLLHLAGRRRDSKTLAWLLEQGVSAKPCHTLGGLPADAVLRGGWGSQGLDCAEPIRVLWKADSRLEKLFGDWGATASSLSLASLLEHPQGGAVVSMLLKEGWDPCKRWKCENQENWSPLAWVERTPGMLETEGGRLIRSFVLGLRLEKALPRTAGAEPGPRPPRF